MAHGFSKKLSTALPDPVFLYLRSSLKRKTVANPWRPHRFTDHILRLLLARDDRRSVFADKLATRDYVVSRLGPGYLPALYQVAEDPDDLDFAALPTRFVVKTNHGSAMNCIVTDRDAVDVAAVRARLRGWLDTDYGAASREFAYRGIARRVFVEQLLELAPGKLCYDYKLYCFAGETRLIQVVADRSLSNPLDRSNGFFSETWQPLDIDWHTPRLESLPAPACLDEMKTVARRLSADFDFLRVDLYIHDGKVIVGELTNFPDGGLGPFTLEQDRWLGAFFAARPAIKTRSLEARPRRSGNRPQAFP